MLANYSNSPTDLFHIIIKPKNSNYANFKYNNLFSPTLCNEMFKHTENRKNVQGMLHLLSTVKADHILPYFLVLYIQYFLYHLKLSWRHSSLFLVLHASVFKIHTLSCYFFLITHLCVCIVCMCVYVFSACFLK